MRAYPAEGEYDGEWEDVRAIRHAKLEGKAKGKGKSNALAKGDGKSSDEQDGRRPRNGT